MLINELKDNFTQVSNEIITDTRITAVAVRVYIYIASKPTGWNVFNQDIQKRLNIKDKQTLANVWKLLISTGYIKRNKITKDMDTNLKVGSYYYKIFAMPVKNPPLDTTHITEKPTFGKNPPHSNTIPLRNIRTNSNKEEEKDKKEIIAYKQVENLNIEAIEMWFNYKGKAYTKQGKTLSINKLRKYPLDIQLKMVENSILNGYKGLFEVKEYKTLAKVENNQNKADISDYVPVEERW